MRCILEKVSARQTMIFLYPEQPGHSLFRGELPIDGHILTGLPVVSHHTTFSGTLLLRRPSSVRQNFSSPSWVWFVGIRRPFLVWTTLADSYISNNVPIRCFPRPARTSWLIHRFPTVFLIMWESGYSLPAAVVSAGPCFCSTTHIFGQTRLILLDATLVFRYVSQRPMLCTILQDGGHDPVSQEKWWKWLLLTGGRTELRKSRPNTLGYLPSSPLGLR